MEGALEVWDYSRYNIENYARRVRKTQPRLQFVPFSFLHTKGSIPLGEHPPSPRQQDTAHNHAKQLGSTHFADSATSVLCLAKPARTSQRHGRCTWQYICPVSPALLVKLYTIPEAMLSMLASAKSFH